MSVIQRIQEKQKWVFGIIALALIVFILEEAFSSSNRGAFSNNSDLGEVNGQTISREEYEHKLSFYEQANGTPRSQLMGNVWDYMVDMAAMNQQYEKLGLKVSADELSDVMFGDNPPQWMQQAFTNPQTGAFDAAAARQQFTQIKKNADDPKNAQLYEGYLEPTIQQTLREKYQSLITSAVYIPKWMAEKANADNNSLAKISYVSIPYATVTDSTIKVTDEDITGYIKKHPKVFEQKDEARQVTYVSFSSAAAKQDSADLENQLNQLKPEFASSTDEKVFLSRNASELPYYNGFISRNELKQSVNDSLFSLSQGAIYGPYADKNNYVLAKLVAERQMPDSVKVRHILVATSQQDQQTGQMMRVRDDSSAKRRLDTALALLRSGVGFDSVCAQYSDDPGSNTKGGVYDYFASGRMMEEFNNFSFTNPVGAKDVVKTNFGYHYVEVLGQKGLSTGYKFAYLAKPIQSSQQTIDAANQAAEQFASGSRTREQFEATAKKLGKKTEIAGDIKPNDNTIAALGESRELVRWAYSAEPNAVSVPMEIGDKYIVAVLTGISSAGLQSAGVARPMVEPIIRNEKKAQQIINAKFKGTTLEQISQAAGAPVQVADSISYQAFVINGIGNEPKILGAAFNKQLQGKVSAPIAGMSGVFAIKGQGVFAAASLGATIDMLKQQMQTQIKSQVGYRSLTAIKDAAKIEDNRSKFY